MDTLLEILDGMSRGELALYWLIFANLTGFILMVRDKHRAETGGWRTPESSLIFWSMVGGSLGTLAAQRLIRHKTRKQPIATLLWVIPLIQGLVLGLYFTGYFPNIGH